MLLLDARPALEFEAGHLPGALSLPLAELPTRLKTLPKDKLIVTYCRGTICVDADEALELVLANGRRGARLEESVSEWREAGYRVERSAPTH